jgi:hypothetical protein
MRKDKFLLVFVLMALSTIMGCEKLVEEGSIPVVTPSTISVIYRVEMIVGIEMRWPDNTEYGLNLPEIAEVEIDGVVKEYDIKESYSYGKSYIYFALPGNKTYQLRIRCKKWNRYSEWVKGPTL